VAEPTVWQATGRDGLAALSGTSTGVTATGVMEGLSPGCSEPSSHSGTSVGGGQTLSREVSEAPYAPACSIA